MASVAIDRLLVLDTNAWLYYCNLGPRTMIDIIRKINDNFKLYGYKLAYTDVTLIEIKKSPRQEIYSRRNNIINCIKRNGSRVGLNYLRLISSLDHVPSDRRDDVALSLAAGKNLLLTMDAWLAQYRLVLGLPVIYLPPEV